MCGVGTMCGMNVGCKRMCCGAGVMWCSAGEERGKKGKTHYTEKKWKRVLFI